MRRDTQVQISIFEVKTLISKQVAKCTMTGLLYSTILVCFTLKGRDAAIHRVFRTRAQEKIAKEPTEIFFSKEVSESLKRVDS